MDTDWASEEQIDFTLSFFDEYHVPVTPFVTHPSRTLERRFSDKRDLVGLHPNFLRGSSHGDKYEEVIDHVRRLWPESVFFRSHCYFDNTHITRHFSKFGFKFDSNLLFFLQGFLLPLKHDSGLLRFPVGWQDDVHLFNRVPLDTAAVIDFLESPGLKVFNFHPVHVYFNTPDHAYYSGLKNGSEKRPFKGRGIQAFLVELLQWMEKEGLRFYTLPELFKTCIDHNHGESLQRIVKKYSEAKPEERTEIVKAFYDSLETTQKYATSRDFNLRELEIEFIRSNVCESKRILDIGCGNGYTLLSLAKSIKAEMVGVDFSERMIDGARVLAQQMLDRGVDRPTFQLGDARELKCADGRFDAVISERCLLNLPSRNDQYLVLQEMHRVLAEGGIAALVEGTLQGLERLNKLRVSVGLEAIPDRSEDNVSSLKLDEVEFENRARRFFTIEKKQDFGMYYLLSRVVHPLLVFPEEPRFDARINEIARKVAALAPSYAGLGHVVGYVFRRLGQSNCH